jgi:hypothetical protein
VLPGQLLAGADPSQAGVDFGLLADLGFGHLVQGFDGNGDLFAAELDEGHPASGFEGAGDGGEHFVGVIELVIDVHHEGEIDRVGGQFGVGQGPEHADHIGDGTAGQVGGEQGEHFRLDIHGVDFAGGTDDLGDAPAVVTGAGADVGDDETGAEVEQGMEEVGAFLVGAFGAFEPKGSLVAHDVGDFAVEEELAGAIAGGGAQFVEWWGGGWGEGSDAEGGSDQAGPAEEMTCVHGGGGGPLGVGGEGEGKVKGELGGRRGGVLGKLRRGMGRLVHI